MRDNYWLIEMTDLSVHIVRNPQEELEERGYGNIVSRISAESIRLEETSFSEAKRYDRENIAQLFSDAYTHSELLFGKEAINRAHLYIK